MISPCRMGMSVYFLCQLYSSICYLHFQSHFLQYFLVEITLCLYIFKICFRITNEVSQSAYLAHH